MSKRCGSVKNFNLLLSLLPRDDPVNEVLFWRKLLFLKGIFKAICDLVLYVLWKGTKSSFTWNVKVPFQYVKDFVVTPCSRLSFVDSLEFNFKQKY